MTARALWSTAGMAVCVAALVVAAPARADFQSLASPGPLARGHASLEQACDRCHVPFKGVPSSACLSCHAETQRRIAAGRGPHATFQKQGKPCASCHEDHRGRDHRLTPEVSEAGFDHLARTGTALPGKHAHAPCGGCHKPGPKRWMNVAERCLDCHADPHKGGLGGSCASCHSPDGWKALRRTLAEHQTPMTGGHAGLACERCHARGSHLVRAASCGDCHDQKHGGTKAPCARCHNVEDWRRASFQHDFCTCILPGKHQTAPCLSCHPAFRFTPTPSACAGCHAKDRRHEDLGACARCHSALSWKTKAFDHDQPRVGFKLEGRHLEVGCENCHPTARSKGRFRGVPKTCEGCHKEPDHGDFGPCATCHTTKGFKPSSFSHDATRFPLDGKHQQVTCQGCHARFTRGRFVPGPNACALCHGDPHDGQFGAQPGAAAQPPRGKVPAAMAPAGRFAALRDWLGVTGAPLLASNSPVAHAVSPARGCLDCHTTRGWTPSTIDASSHARFGFALAGAHAQAACDRCHADDRFAGTPRDCVGCHIDRHARRFGGDCARCHEPSSWDRHPRFDHTETGFRLEGAHAGKACAACHGPDRQRLRRVRQVGCATCHQPRHGEQLGRACEACHRPTRFSDVPAFDHRLTLFPLDRRHAAVRCGACHDATRGRLRPECQACHGDPHRGRAQLACEDCHRADRFNLVRFDHNRSIFPLRGRHFATPCRACHTNDQFTGTRTECVACHRGDRQRVDGMLTFHRGFGPDCAECHVPFDWKMVSR